METVVVVCNRSGFENGEQASARQAIPDRALNLMTAR